MWYGQVAALALCKHNKARLLAGRLTVGWRHKRARQLFWRYDQIPEECLQVGPLIIAVLNFDDRTCISCRVPG